MEAMLVLLGSGLKSSTGLCCKIVTELWGVAKIGEATQSLQEETEGERGRKQKYIFIHIKHRYI
jgi:hypothetical protein